MIAILCMETLHRCVIREACLSQSASFLHSELFVQDFFILNVSVQKEWTFQFNTSSNLPSNI